VDTVRAFVEKELYPHEEEVKRLDEVPAELAARIRRKAIAAGLYAANMPAELGGGGLDAVSVISSSSSIASLLHPGQPGFTSSRFCLRACWRAPGG
jgi:alkylation response protein AidB-like acyl-CoA dehydrogenase